MSAPYNPNQNPVEHYMEITSSHTRSLLVISGLDPENYWEIALEHAINIQIRTAIPGRFTPYELTYGKRPDVVNLRIFGCQALAYREKDKRAKFTPKVDQCIYVGMSQHIRMTHLQTIEPEDTQVRSSIDDKCSSMKGPFPLAKTNHY
jgi:hypothetical protein